MRDFTIPMNREDLVTASSNFFVENHYNIRDLKTKLKELEMSAAHQGVDCITDGGFDILFSVLQNFQKELPSDNKQTAFQILNNVMNDLLERVDKHLQRLVPSSDDVPSHGETAEQCNQMKMTVYLFCQLLELIEAEETKGDPLAKVAAKGKKPKKASKHDDFTWSWDQERMKGLTVLHRLLQLNLNRIFESHMVEEEFINLIANCNFRILENPEVAKQTNKSTRMSTFQVLGTLNHKYNFSLSCSLKIVQELKHFEHLVIPFAEAMEMFATEYNSRGMVMEVIREIAQVDGRELSRDTSGTRSYSQFLVELSSRLPEQTKPCLSLLVTHLDGESYSMRKSVLTVLGEIVLRVLSGEEQEEASKEARDQFLECLEDHFHDVHAHVRSTVLQIWNKLCSARAIPLNRQHQVLGLVIGRLQDKSSLVRKQAVQLLTTFLQCNPFGAQLPVKDLQEELDKEKAKLAELTKDEEPEPSQEEWEKVERKLEKEIEKELPEEGEKVWEGAAVGEVKERIRYFLKRLDCFKAIQLFYSGKDAFPDDEAFNIGDEKMDDKEEAEDDDDEEEDEAGTRVIEALKTIFFAKPIEPEPSQTQCQDNSVDEITRQKNIVTYMKNAVHFAELVHSGLGVACQLLGSKQPSDILEAINFFVSAFEFGLLDAMMGVRQMLALIWSRETSIKEAVVNAYKRLYINMDGNGAASQVVKNLIALISGATIGELTSLEELIGMLVRSKEIDKDCFHVAWKYFTKAMPHTTDEEARSALVLLGMFATEKPEIITSNIAVIVEHGLGEAGEQSFKLVHDACSTILKIVPPKPKTESLEPPIKFDPDHPMFERLEAILVNGIERKEDKQYVPMVTKAVSVIFQLCDKAPDVLAGNMIKKICTNLVPKIKENGQLPSYIVTRLFSLVGHVAICTLRYLDVSVFNELKRRNYVREAKEEQKQKDAKKKKRRSVVASCASETPRTASQVDEEDDIVGAVADDAEGEFIRNVCEKEIVTGGGLLGMFAPMLSKVCINSTKYDTDLVAAASLALAKFMLVSNDFCDTHLQLLFTLLERSHVPVIRANLIIAAGDLSFRFPNTVEPWTPRMYARLGDESPLVRSNTLTVLTHLILNDMIKVKGYISEMAKCIVDKVEKISNLARLFFTELAQKGNALYNVMPDIISRLSDQHNGVDEDTFREILRFITCLIEKDKHLESLVEKLCHRFRATETERQWRDLAYVLSLFSYSERSVKRLADNFSCFGDKLYESSVYDSLAGILVQARKLAKQETKLMLDELETQMEEAREKGVEDDTANRRARAAKEGRRKSAKTPGKRRSKKVESSDEEEEEPELESDEEEKKTRRRSKRLEEEEEPAKTRRKSNRVESSDEDEEEEKEKKKTAKTPARRKKVESSDEEEEEDRQKGKKKTAKTPARRKKVESSDEEEEEDDEEEKENEDETQKGKKRVASKSPPTHVKKKGRPAKTPAKRAQKSPSPSASTRKMPRRGNRK